MKEYYYPKPDKIDIQYKHGFDIVHCTMELKGGYIKGVIADETVKLLNSKGIVVIPVEGKEWLP